MLTIRFDQLGVQPGDLVLDAGAGFGRHAFELARQGANVVALDYAAERGRRHAGHVRGDGRGRRDRRGRFAGGLHGDATRLPFADDTFDRVITCEVLEHIQADTAAIAELVRVLKPGGTFAATVPTWLPEKINWMLSDEYHAPKSVGGHVRIYSATELKAKLRSAGLGDHRQPPRPRAALAVLVAEVRGRRPTRRPPAGEGLPAAARVGHRQAAAQHEGGRARRCHRCSARASSCTPERRPES